MSNSVRVGLIHLNPKGAAHYSRAPATVKSQQAGDMAGACGSLAAFLNEVRAQTGHKLSEAQA